MGVIFDEPKYPVIDKAPGFWKTGVVSLPIAQDRFDTNLLYDNIRIRTCASIINNRAHVDT